MSGEDIKQIILTAMCLGASITALVILYKTDKNIRNDKDNKNNYDGKRGEK